MAIFIYNTKGYIFDFLRIFSNVSRQENIRLTCKNSAPLIVREFINYLHEYVLLGNSLVDSFK